MALRLARTSPAVASGRNLFWEEGVMRRIRILQSLIGTTVATGGVITFMPAAHAATIPVACSQRALVAAVSLANSTAAADTLALASGCTYRMTSPHGGPDNALPVITTPIEMIGPATITRSSLLPFRVAEVSTTGSLTLTTSVALTNGSAVGDGGAILNRGAVTLTVSSLSGNHATGNGGGLANADTPAGTAPAATFTGNSVSNNSATLSGGGIYNGVRGTLTTTGLPMFVTGNTAVVNGGGIAAVNSTATTLTGTTVTTNVGVLGGGVYRQGGTMTTTNSPISANLVNNCVGSAPAVPNCTG
jgi:parallel beta-helix repeat protein